MVMNDDAALLIERLIKRDQLLWQGNDNPPLGWLDSIGFIQEHACNLMQWAKSLMVERQIEQIVLIGMGGASLATEVFYSVFGRQNGFPEITILDTTSPAVLHQLKISDQTLFIVASKSGNTIETMCLYAWLFERAKSLKGHPNKKFIAITDADTDLGKIASTENFLHVFVNPNDIVGRFSALSYFSLVPAALMGIDLVRLGKQLNRAWSNCLTGKSSELVNMIQAMNACSASGYGILRVDIQFPLYPLFGWIEQLVAESTGKQGKGILLVHSKQIDRKILTSDKYQSIRITMQDEYDLGGIFMQWMAAVSIAASYLNINAFDQPDVEASKKQTLRLVEDSLQKSSDEKHYDFKNITIQFGTQPITILKNKIEKFCKQTGKESYLAILAYLPRERSIEKSLEKLADSFMSVFDIVTIGFGPRYLHSTGQYHKGGPQIGSFLEIIEENELEIPIPGREYGFGRLHQAQADGDLLILEKKQRPVLRFMIQGERLEELDRLTQLLTSMAK